MQEGTDSIADALASIDTHYVRTTQRARDLPRRVSRDAGGE